ncbi:cytochrome c [Dyadobacter chenwenxiniae]|uniref:Cytochrome c n=1 Tax=Dyadobacter chenwenxiniae TaxID=2906456 RepID=A0A9X1PJ69_9BACT|nr:cytochrome c [Dyadobacter chenwenxiniae]MCF0061853.1 cytochrome c [Dyadobacter chenwenxiniae]UON81668.1 cytochrome c [Dyadobacter chenwenxiniae]
MPFREGLLFVLLLLCDLCAGQVPEFYKDVQPIVHANCVPCHRTGEAAPFPLITFEDVSKRSKFIKQVVSSRYMPPWKADNHFNSFANDRSLSDKDIKTIVGWIDGGTPKGKQNLKAEQDLQARVNAGTAYKRKPDLSLRLKEGFVVKGDAAERFVMFKIPFELGQEANVEAIEFTSNNKKLIHHANFAIHPVADPAIDLNNTVDFVDLSGPSGDKYYEWVKYKKEMTYYGGWIPGTTVETYPEDMGWVMPKRGVVLVTVHFGPSSVDAESMDGVNIFFKTSPIKRKVKVISLGSGGIGEKDISPPFMIFADEVKSFRLRIANNQPDVSLLYAWPHMHYLGKEFKAYATTAAGDTIKLVHVPAWDFRWQEIYKYKKPLLLPKGAIVHVEGTYDNTAANPANPHRPPELVMSTGNMRSDQEMMTLILMYVERAAGDENLVFKWN